MTPTHKKCLNCGTPIADGCLYCHKCGQAAATERLSTKSFAMSIFMGLTRINRGVIFTCCNLLLRPWRVIADYIRGRRVCYTPPVQLLLILTFFIVALSALLDMPAKESVEAHSALFDTSTAGGRIAQTIVRFFLNSTIVQYLVMFIPAIPALMWFNKINGAYRYNFAECLLAAIYMSDAVLVFLLIMTPFDAFLPVSAVNLAYLYVLIVGVCGFCKSQARLSVSKAKMALRVMAFMLVSLLTYLLILSIIAAIAMLVMINVRAT